MLADGTRPDPRARGYADGVTLFDRLGRFVVRRRWWVVGAWALVLLAALPFAPRAPERPVGRWLHPRRPRVGAREGPPREGARAAAVGARRRLPQRHARRRHAGVRARRGRRRCATSPTLPTSPASCRTLVAPRQVSADGHTAYDVVLLDLPPDDSPDAAPDPRGTARLGTRAGGRARRRPGVLRRRPARLGGGPAPERADLAAARGARAAPRVRLARGGRRAARGRRGGGGRRARRDLRRRRRSRR